MEFSDDDVLNFIEEKLSTIRTATPALSKIERALITSAWRDRRRTYREIAEAEGYSQSYVHNVATELWDSLSIAFGTRVRKPNMKEIVSRCILEEQQPSSQAVFPFRKTPTNLQLIRYRRTNKSYTETLTDEVKLTLMLIPAGKFMMGASEYELDSGDSERPQHQVEVSQFLMGCYPITQAQWRVVAGYERVDKDLNPDPSRFKGDHRPVEQVTWNDAVEFCNRLSAKTEKNYRLPSEAEWEYACRAGTDTPFHFGETLTTELANYYGPATYNNGPVGEHRGETTEVGIFPANDWGLHDMHGNVWEWCEDDWHDNYEKAPENSSAWIKTEEFYIMDPAAGTGTFALAALDQTIALRVLRGGSWSHHSEFCRSAFRFNFVQNDIYNAVGFRVCCVPPRTLLSS